MNGKTLLTDGSRRFNNKMEIVPQLTDRFNAIHIKISAGVSEIDKLNIKIIWECKGPRRGKIILKKRTKFKKTQKFQFLLLTSI